MVNFPLAALRLSAAAVDLLTLLGIERIGQLIDLPRDQVAQRFGPEVGLRLDQLLGRVAEVIVPIHPRPDASASWAFDDPVERHDVVVQVLDRLLERLQTILEKRRCGTRLVECVLELDDGTLERFECSLSRPAQTAAYLSGLMRTRLEQVRVPAPIRALCVRAAVLERIPDEQPSLFDDGESNEAALAQLLDSLASRLGQDVVTRARFVADPQPELACVFDSALAPDRGIRFQSCDQTSHDWNRMPRNPEEVFSHRPLRLLRQPAAIQVVALFSCGGILLSDESARSESCRHDIQRFHHAGTEYKVVRCRGPERIETGWWRGDDVRRDYFLVETSGGTRWWIFQRIIDGRWFLHGCFE